MRTTTEPVWRGEIEVDGDVHEDEGDDELEEGGSSTGFSSSPCDGGEAVRPLARRISWQLRHTRMRCSDPRNSMVT